MHESESERSEYIEAYMSMGRTTVTFFVKDAERNVTTSGMNGENVGSVVDRALFVFFVKMLRLMSLLHYSWHRE